MKISTGEELFVFKCYSYDKENGWSHVLNGHEIIHTVEKPFKCQNCDKKYTDTSNLKKNERIHMDG